MKPCPGCPFRPESPVGYDADALEALDAGAEPSCHALVGTESIFRDDPTTRCAGFEAWAEGRAGFVRPALAAGDLQKKYPKVW